MQNVFQHPISPAVLSWDQDTPVAREYDDSYFARYQGPAETEYVFLQGNQLAQRFQRLPNNGFFVIGETGFGTGLNFLAAAYCFLQQAPSKARLHFISTEKHPFTAEDLQKAQSFWPQFASLADELQRVFPEPTPGFHRRSLANERIQLTLIYADVQEGLEQFSSQVDAWFLDGFAPAKNPSMWQQSLYELMARSSAPGATIATFTAAGFVRRGLIDAGFAMRKRKGFGMKRDMIVGQLAASHWQPQTYKSGTVAIIGAGLSGATCARRLAELGWQVHVYEKTHIAAGASGNLAGVLYATPSAVGTPQNLFYQHSYLHALARFKQLGFPASKEYGKLNGVYYSLNNPRQKDKIHKAVNSIHWPSQLLQQVTDNQAFLPQSGYIHPAAWCQHLLKHPNIQIWRSKISANQLDNLPLGVASQVVLANSFAAQQFTPQSLPLRPQRGQVSYVKATEKSKQWQHAHCHRGYLTPAINNLHCVGATFDRHHRNPEPKPEDNARNLNELKENMPSFWQDLGGDAATIVDSRVEYRCQTPDYLPLVGQLQNSLYVSAAHGSRGITHTPLCADIIAANISGEPSPTGQYILQALQPNRFSDV